jgi:hypothetical protein
MRRGPDYKVTAAGCWEWQHALTTAGYGSVRDGQNVVYAHRLYFERHCGAIPDGHELDHLCRNRACVNPTHLEAVTHAENVRRGGGTKLTDEQVAEILDRCRRGDRKKDIAADFGINPSYVSNLKAGRASRLRAGSQGGLR